MIPLKDYNFSRKTPISTLGLILINGLIFLYETCLDPVSIERFVYTYGFVPSRLGFHALFPGLLSSLFLHADWLHLTGNLLFLWVFGENLENRLGGFNFLALYLLSGILANLGQLLVTPQVHLPVIGASGAIAGIMGAYLILLPKSRILTLLPRGFSLQIVSLPAGFYISLWFMLQLLFWMTGARNSGVHVAWGTHWGGFLSGASLALMLKIIINKKEEPAYD